MTDDEMRGMPIPSLQDEGLLFLWVTGRAMEVGRECMRVWGYTRVDELIWVKINQVITTVTHAHPSLKLSPFITAPTTDTYWAYGALA
jgi:N6-adenosine-specific RNA methylase IME4